VVIQEWVILPVNVGRKDVSVIGDGVNAPKKQKAELKNGEQFGDIYKKFTIGVLSFEYPEDLD
jgi:hypothetical protein